MGHRDEEHGAAVAEIERLHAEVDREAAGVAAQHPGRLQCRLGCSSCCVDGLTVFDVEALRIRAAFGKLLATGVPHAAGACAFLDDAGGCRIYAARPYVCRTQGLPLRWIDDDGVGDDIDGEIVEQRDICVLNDQPEGGSFVPIEALDAEACWTLGPYEGRLAELQRKLGGDGPTGLKRVALRGLWGDGADGDER